MESGLSSSKICQNHIEEGDRQETQKTHEQSILSTLPRGKTWLILKDNWMYQYQGFWYYKFILEELLSANIKLSWGNINSSSILLCCNPKCGTTWLKALTFAIVTRNPYKNLNENPLLTSLSHDLIPFIEDPNRVPNHSQLVPDLLLFSTQIPYTSLPKPVLDSECKIVYICRDPKDTLISRWKYINKHIPSTRDSSPTITLDEAFDIFCHGVFVYRPFWDHVLGYWKASLDHPNKVMFLKYEDMMRDPVSHVSSLGKFMGYPFSNEEEREGVHERIVEMCSFDSLSNLEVNKSGTNAHLRGGTHPNILFFRNGKVGDWKNYLTQEMADKIDEITTMKFGPFGLRL